MLKQRRVLTICSGFPTDSEPHRNVFIKEQIESVEKLNRGFQFDVFPINQERNKINYARAIGKLCKLANENRYALFHAHFGLSALTCLWQHRIPVVVTFHGCDINAGYSRAYAKLILANRVSFFIFVNKRQSQLMHNPENSAVLPCGVDMSLFYPIDKEYARLKLGLHTQRKYIVFPSDRRRREKNFGAAQQALSCLRSKSVELIELDGFTRSEVNYFLNAADVLLMTSVREGSPQTIKEAMACNLPIVSTDVGDVREVVGSTEGCYITSFEPEDIATKLEMALEYGKRTDGRQKIKHLDIHNVAKVIVSIYKRVLK